MPAGQGLSDCHTSIELLCFICKAEKCKEYEGTKRGHPASEFKNDNDCVITPPEGSGNLINMGVVIVSVFPGNPWLNRGDCGIEPYGKDGQRCTQKNIAHSKCHEAEVATDSEGGGRRI